MAAGADEDHAGDGGADRPLLADCYEQAFGGMAHAVVATDLGERVCYWNAAAERLYGYPAAEVVGRPVGELIVLIEPDPATRHGQLPLRAGDGCIGDRRVRDRGDREFTVSAGSTPITDRNGAVVGMLDVSHDVTQHRLAQARADELAAVVGGTADAILRTDLDLVVGRANGAHLVGISGADPQVDATPCLPAGSALTEYWSQVRFDQGLLPRALILLGGQLASMNDSFCRLFGRTRAELTGLAAPDLRHPSGDGTPDKLHALLAGEREAESWERIFLRRDGAPIPALVHASIMRHADGTPQAVAVCIQDLSGLRHAEAHLRGREALFEALGRRASDWAFVLDPAGVVRYASPAVADACGYRAGEMVGRLGWETAHRDDVAAVRRAFQTVVADAARTEMVTFRAADRSGGWYWVEEVFTNCLDDPQVAGVVCNRRDVTARVSAERALRDSESRYRAIAETARDGIWTIDTDGRTMFANRKLADILGLSVEAVYAQWAPQVLAPGDTMVIEERLRHQRDSMVEEYELTYPHPDGHPRLLKLSVSPLRDDAGQPGVLAIVTEVTAARRAESELRQRALSDELTGLGNRSLLLDRLEHTLAGFTRRPGTVAVLFADLDQFKLINDSWGHGTGDRLLVKVAQRLAGAARSGDSVVRFGGDEFVVVCEDVSEGEARKVAGRMLTALADPFEVDGQRVYVRASIGIAISPPGSALELLRFAEAAMYEAKARGRARVQVFDVGLAEQASERLELSNDLRDALSRDELQLQYQPVVDLTTGRLLGLEALARWHHPRRGPVSPATFVDIAETTGLSTALDRWVLRRVATEARQLAPAMPSGLRIAVNISARHLADDDLEAAVLATVRSRPLASGRLVLEITENAVMDSPERSRLLLERLLACGVETAIDDFGTGYSSLGYLSRLPVTTLKIDRCFVKDITDDPDALAIATSIMELARAMRLTTIAEGVETVEQLTVLRRLGCAAGQGFLWSPAVAPATLVQIVARLPQGRFAVGGAEPTTPARSEPGRR